MIVTEVLRFLRSRLDSREIYLKNFVPSEHEYGALTEEPLVSIVIPTRDNHVLLKDCVDSVTSRTSYKNFQIVVVNNDSRDPQSLNYLEALKQEGVKVIDYSHPFNYSEICNLGVSESRGEYICFLNNDTEILDGAWLGSMVSHASRPGVGVVGSKLLYPNGRLQHLGVALGYKGVAGHAFAGLSPTTASELLGVSSCFEVSAVSFACAMVKRINFEKTGGLKTALKVGLNDIDYCLRSAQRGLVNIVCLETCLTHHESKSRRTPLSWKGGPRAIYEVLWFLWHHGKRIRNDEYFAYSNR